MSGSFHRHLVEIQSAVAALTRAGAVVLSPCDPRVVDAIGEFLFVASDLRRSIRGIQNRHYEAIRHSDFLWLECSDGYIGTSAAAEVGFATALDIPVMATTPPDDLTMRQYVTVVADEAAAVRLARTNPRSPTSELGLLLDPAGTLAEAHSELDAIHTELSCGRHQEHDPAETHLHRLATLLDTPTRR